MRVIPDRTIFGIELNPGPFTIKEHVCLSLCQTLLADLIVASIPGARDHYGQRWRSGGLRQRHSCRPKGILQTDLVVRVQLDVGHVDAVDRFFHRRNHETVFGITTFDE